MWIDICLLHIAKSEGTLSFSILSLWDKSLFQLFYLTDEVATETAFEIFFIRFEHFWCNSDSEFSIKTWFKNWEWKWNNVKK